MKKVFAYIKNGFILFFALVILLITSGFNIYKHTCSTTQTYNISIVIPVEKCDHAESEHIKNSCCNESDDSQNCTPTKSNNHNDNDCCKDKTEYKKLNIDIVTDCDTVEVKALNTLIVQMLYANTFYALNNQYSFVTSEIKESPPPITISKYLSVIQVYLI